MIEIVTSIQTLMLLAKKVGKAKKTGDKVALKEALLELEQYKDIIRRSEKMVLHCRVGDI